MVMSVTAVNRYLTRSEMEGNARYIWDFFRGNGWTMSAVAAMLGNMETESTINPAIYENLDNTSTVNGFGLVQWTPNTKYKTWADANGYAGNYEHIDGQLARILWEVANGEQWISLPEFNDVSFESFSQSNDAPEYLADMFLKCYERPADTNQPNRGTQARAWFTFLETSDPLTPTTPTPQTDEPKQMSKLLLYWAGVHRR